MAIPIPKQSIDAHTIDNYSIANFSLLWNAFFIIFMKHPPRKFEFFATNVEKLKGSWRPWRLSRAYKVDTSYFFFLLTILGNWIIEYQSVVILLNISSVILRLYIYQQWIRRYNKDTSYQIRLSYLSTKPTIVGDE